MICFANSIQFDAVLGFSLRTLVFRFSARVQLYSRLELMLLVILVSRVQNSRFRIHCNDSISIVQEYAVLISKFPT